MHNDCVDIIGSKGNAKRVIETTWIVILHTYTINYKAASIFDPHQLPTFTHNISDYSVITAFQNPPALHEESLNYCQSPTDSSICFIQLLGWQVVGLSDSIDNAI